ncbi:MAG: PAS domain S-box protein [Anaerolineae bacterium]|nr:PAS domain S-box protein [Anaerolineae bacterium]
MSDADKTRSQLLQELAEARRQIAELKAASAPAPNDNAERYRIVSELTADRAYAIAVDPTGTLAPAWVSDIFTSITGYSIDEILAQQDWSTLIHSDDLPGMSAHYAALCAGRPDAREFRVIAKSGETRWVRNHARPVWDEDQSRVVLIYGATQDITEYKRAEEALRENKRQYALAVNAGKVGVWNWNLATGEMYLDPILKAMLGYRDDEIRNYMNEWGRLVHPDDINMMIEETRAHIAGEKPEYECEHRMMHKDGSIRWFMTRGTALRDKDGNAYTIAGTDTDITERKRAEEALRESEARYRAVIEDQTEFICRFKSDGTLTFVNRAYCDYHSKSCEEIIGSTFIPVIPDEDYQNARRSIAALTPQNPVGTFELRVILTGGETRWQRWTVRAIYDPSGAFVEFQSVGRDITERKRAEEALARRTRALAALRETALDFGAELELPSLLRRVMTHAVDLFDADRGGAIYLYEPGEDVLRLTESSHMSKGYTGTTLRPGEGVAGRVFQTRQPFAVNDYSVWEGRAAIYAGAPPASVLGIPLSWQERVFGVLDLYADPLKRTFGPDDLWLAEMFAALPALAIRNARLFEEVRRQREQLRTLTVQLSEAEESERRRLAAALHDLVGQSLTVLGINLKIIETQVTGTTPKEVHAYLGDSMGLVKQITENVREVMVDLRPPVLDDYGLMVALHWYGDRIATRAGITVDVAGEEPVPPLPGPINDVLFRIAQEALTNVTKHAQATQVKIALISDDATIRLGIEDNGVGFDLRHRTEIDERPHWGVITMIERAETIGGRCRIESQPGQGTRVTVEVAR